MSSARIFAAVDMNGNTRFVGDVPGGSACGCFCAVCGSALIARHGNVNVWHFAHEAGQEREACLVGAMNLLRRLAAEYLRSLPTLVLPPFRQVVARVLQTRRVSENVEWDAQPTSVSWLEAGAQDAPIARLTLDNEVIVELFVEIGEAPPTRRFQTESTVGKVVF